GELLEGGARLLAPALGVLGQPARAILDGADRALPLVDGGAAHLELAGRLGQRRLARRQPLLAPRQLLVRRAHLAVRGGAQLQALLARLGLGGAPDGAGL